jgi:ectoine hydroxylase-related dioxygenase (phytanoyl-CoA dioxygenase family)
MPEDHLMRVSEGDGHVRVALHLCHVDEAFREQARDRRIAAMVASVLEEPVVVLTSLLFNKPPKVGEGLTLHQDLPYYPYLGDDDLVTCWLALDRTTPENGRVEYLPGSHQSVVSHQATGGQQALDIDPEDVNISTAVGVSLAAGEAVLHHGLTVHRSAPNTSIASRMGLATLYVKASAKVTLEDFPYSPLDPYGQHADREG